MLSGCLCFISKTSISVNQNVDLVLFFFTCMKWYFSYLYLHCLGSLMISDFLSWTFTYYLLLCKNLSSVGYIRNIQYLNLNFSLKITSPVNLTISVMKPTAPQNKNRDSNFVHGYTNLNLKRSCCSEFKKIYKNFIFIVVFIFPKLTH